jgi:dihydrofolate reductase
MQALSDAGGLLLGRRTYEIFAGFWPKQPDDDPLAPTLNGLPKYVVSRTLEEPLEWANSTLIDGEVAPSVLELRQAEGGDLLVIGSGELVRTLMAHDLVDEYQLMIHPLVLGTGKHLFSEGGTRIDLRLVDHTVSGTGILLLTYRPVAK